MKTVKFAKNIESTLVKLVKEVMMKQLIIKPRNVVEL